MGKPQSQVKLVYCTACQKRRPFYTLWHKAHKCRVCFIRIQYELQRKITAQYKADMRVVDQRIREARKVASDG